MTNPDELEALAVRCEQASGPDREMDADIYEAITGTCSHRHIMTVLGDGDGWGEVCSRCCAEEPDHVIRPYTASLDAAMTLLDNYRQYDPDQYGFAPGVARSHDGTGIADVHISPYGEMVRAKAATPALALCSAALLALHARTLHPLSSDTEGMVK